MEKKAKNEHFKRDLILIVSITIIVLGILIFSLATKKKGELAYIKYNNETLFTVDLMSGKYQAITEDYQVTELPKIENETLVIAGEVNDKLKWGEGVIVFENHYFIMGYLGYIHIEYSSEKKMIRVVTETSPYHICSGLGYSNSNPIICLPNLVTITFNERVDLII
ncbi:MAG: hypothetical protein WCS12_04815 [Acholeplasmataceae bacterium]|jgi:hypothetical protein|nr:hypothetical protein [Acholeplasmataceae bacterium]MCK9289959.1 hypothetical protein [Acholeplasmataceae bacterium]MCK9428117.1 hypothetical protein [Acholeplasmataceae bacterium]MDD4090718.1 hypothetical protein [Acholeplasmataceae bacterium]HHT39720.1 hypothetical protein [Acholeplasmataceae bacterium]